MMKMTRESLSKNEAIKWTKEGELLRLTDYNLNMQQDWFGKYTSYRKPISKKVKIYRAVPLHIKSIDYGDYVTQSKSYAKMHLDSILRGDGHILSKTISIDELSPVNPNEFYYIPSKEYFK